MPERRPTRFERAQPFILCRHDEAFRWLNRAVAEHSGNPIATQRELRPLYSDSRFPLLLRRMGIDPTKMVGRQPAK